MNYVASVEDGKAVGNWFADSPYLGLLHYLIGLPRLLDEVTQQIALLRVFHHNAEIPRAMLVLFEETVVDMDEERAVESFQESYFLHNSRFLLIRYRFAHENFLERNFLR